MNTALEQFKIFKRKFMNCSLVSRRGGRGKHPEDGEMNEMTLPFRHWIRNSNPAGLRPTSLLLGHGGLPTILNLNK